MFLVYDNTNSVAYSLERRKAREEGEGGLKNKVNRGITMRMEREKQADI